MNYVAFEVGDKSLRLRMDTKNTVNLERLIGTSPVNELMKCAGGYLPTMDFVSSTLHASLQTLEHGYTLDKVYKLIDEYVKDDKSLVDIIPTLMEVFQLAGLIPKAKEEEAEELDPK